MGYFDSYVRLEPTSPVGDLDEGFAARIADPAWFLARQWQLGEHHAEDAGSPVLVRYSVKLQPVVDPYGRDAQTTPTEALVESELHQWWTPGRRVRIGANLLRRAEAEDAALADRLRGPSFRVRDLPEPYAFLDGGAPDGWRIQLERAALGVPDSWFSDVPPEAISGSPDAWNASRFSYATHLDAGRVQLNLSHQGGRIDWYACDASAGRATSAPIIDHGVALPLRMTYLGAPAPRWWELENRRFDIGGFPPDRSHFATLLLIDVVSSHSDDWFSFPVDTEHAAMGQLVTLISIRVTDSFGTTYELLAPRDRWSLFEVEGLAPLLEASEAWSVLVLPNAVTPLDGPPLDEIDLNIDEDANLLWAAERRVGGVSMSDTIPSDADSLAPGYQADTSQAIPQRYDPTSPLRRHWHPYTLSAPRLFDEHTETVAGVRDDYHDER